MRNTYVTVSLDAIRNNAAVIRQHCSDGVKVCAVVKADAYGHGMVPVADALADQVDYFAVALVAEGMTLRNHGITLPILVLAAIDQDEIDKAIIHDLTLTASSIDKLDMIADRARILNKIPVVHLKIDTGMNRIGVHWNRAKPFLEHAHALHQEGIVHCEGMYSHFADSMDANFTRLQFERFQSIVDQAKIIGLSLPLVHICSSRALFLYPEYQLSMVRPGIALYGIEPEYAVSILPKTIKLALEWKTKVVYFKVVEHDESVGYGRTYSLNENERIITLPVGYADGFPRRLSSCGSVIIHGKRYPIVGRVCMDQVMVSLGKDGEAYLGDIVTLIGTDGDASITVEDIAKTIDTTPHEITTCISNRVPRIYK